MRREVAIGLGASALDNLMPMHVVADAEGVITHAGPVLTKIHPAGPVVGVRFFDLFEARRPRQAENLAEIARQSGRKVHLRLRDPARTPLIGVVARLDAGEGVLVNLSFGIAVIDAVARFNLAGSDFAATDLTLEMLYLVEAKSAAMAESRKLNERLHGAKTMAEAEARSDTLTGLSNRRALDQALERLIARETPFTLMHLDLDYFKQVNDTLGHAAGDLVLTEVARILLEETRCEDLVARVGGDEFILIFNEMTDRERMRAIAARLLARLEAPIAYADRTARISASIGMVATTAYARPRAETMMQAADLALYASKRHGRACYTFHEPQAPDIETDKGREA